MEPTEEEKRAYAERAAALEAKYAARQQAEPADSAAPLPTVQSSDQGGEVSLSVDETNKLRAALGLAPLTSGSQKDEAEAEHRRHQDAQAARSKKVSEEVAREKLAAAQERRRLEKELKQTKSLGAADDYEDDVGVWLRAQKAGGQAADGQAEEPAAGERGSRKRRKRGKETSGDADASEDGTAAGVKVKGSAVELEAGETMILTLADRGILGEDGNIDDEADVLENYDRVQQEQIDKAKRKAGKKKLHFEEDGKVHNLLSKYDEEEAEVLLNLENDATIDDSALRSAVAARLEQSAAPTLFRSAEEKYGRVSEYLSAEEVKSATFKKRKKKGEAGGKARKSRRRAAEDDEDGAAGGGGASLFDELEAAAMEVDEDGADRGNRRADRGPREEDVEVEALAERSRRFDLALEKANYASLARRALEEGAGQDAVGADEDETQLEERLVKTRLRSRREAAADDADGEEGKLAALAADMIKKREEDDALDAPLDGDVLGETHDFVSGLVVDDDAAGEEGPPPPPDELPDAEPDVADVVKEEPPEAPPPPPEVGGWVAADPDPEANTAELGGGGAPGGGARAPGRRFRNKGGAAGGAEAPEDAAAGASTSGRAEAAAAMDADMQQLGRQAGIRRGLAAALQLLRDTGGLKDTVSWAGRASDQKGTFSMVKDALLDDDSEVAAEVAAALQRRDEYGRVLTPKEAFRDISYAFHGMTKAVSKREKNMKAVANELHAKAALSADNPSQLLDMYKKGLWRPPRAKKGPGGGKGGKGGGKGGGAGGGGKGGGGGKTAEGGGGKGADKAKGAGAAKPPKPPKFSGMVTPSLGGRDTPLQGAKKVEAMFPGLKKP